MEILAKTLEDARQSLLDKHSYTISSRTREGLDFWIKNASADPLNECVKRAMVDNNLQGEEIRKEIYASLKFRCLAGMIHTPIYPEIAGGICDKLEYDPEKDMFYCNVPGNQDQADNWHEVFGFSYTCPFREVRQQGAYQTPDELEKLLDEDYDIQQAYRILGI